MLNLVSLLKTAGHSLVNVRRARQHWPHVISGAREFSRSGKTPEDAYQSMIRLFCMTNGHSNDLFHSMIVARNPLCTFPSANGVLGDLRPQDVSSLAEQIRTEGYCVFPNKLSSDLCDRLTEFSLSHEARIYPPREAAPKMSVYSPSNPQGDTYWFDEQTVLQCREVQTLMADYSLLSLAQAYLQCPPILDIVDMWWSTSRYFNEAGKSGAGQRFHFDMNRIKWLKVMIYLTDVHSGSGPHCFIPGTHRAGSQYRDLLKRGYARYTDDEVQQRYPNAMRELTGPRGTIIAVDTRGLHKGKTPESGHRLAFQLNYCDSMFGGAFTDAALPSDCAAELRAAVQRYPQLYKRYAIDPGSSKRQAA